MSEKDIKNPPNPINSSLPAGERQTFGQAGILDKIMGSQTQNSLNEFQPITLVSNLLLNLRERDRQILGKRFGLEGMEMETLEAIGKNYNLTRERVRQIEKDSLNLLIKKAGKGASSSKPTELEKSIQLIFDTIKEHGSVIGEDFLMQTMQVAKSDLKERQSVKFLLNLGSQFKNLRETNEYNEMWMIAGFDLGKLQQVISEFMTILETFGRVVSSDELYREFKLTSFYKQNEIELTDKVLKCYLNLAKIIQINPFNEIGLKKWSEVSPRDVGDKAFLVLKHHGKPEHYSLITKMINDHKFDNRTAFQETVHNELIKDDRFVLVGRGIYALLSWGYKKGVVADVIKEILILSGRPMTKDEIITEVLKKRQVKRNTILVGLSNRKNFSKVGKDKYTITENLPEAA